MDSMNEEYVEVGGPDYHGARPMKVVADPSGERWLCDQDVREDKEFKEQGCWRCGELAFTRND